MPIEEIGNIAKKNSIYYLVDAAQSAGVYHIEVEKMNIDMLAFPGHKGLLGPQGTGGLYIREGIEVKRTQPRWDRQHIPFVRSTKYISR